MADRGGRPAGPHQLGSHLWLHEERGGAGARRPPGRIGAHRSPAAPAPGRASGVYDYLIVGAGFAGCVTAERLAADGGKRVLLVEKRNHIGGNAHDHFDASGLLVHKYGPHIFHTNSREVFAYLSRFTEWR